MNELDRLHAAQTRIVEWRGDAKKFVRDVLQVKELDEWQAEALDAVCNLEKPRERIALQACAGPGKTAVLAWKDLWFTTCFAREGEHPRGAAVAITGDNLHSNLWPEIAKWRERSPFLLEAFELNSNRLFARQHPKTWFYEARSFPKKANPEEMGRTLSGIHSAFVNFSIDESGDVPPSVGRAAEQALSRCEFGRVMQAGNPTSTLGMLYEAATSSLWKVIRITGDPDDPRRSPKIDIEWARQQIQEWTRENPWVMVYILGKFPPTGLNQLLGPDDVLEAMERQIPEHAYAWSQKRLGVDVARFGDDESVIFPRQGLASFMPTVKKGLPTDEVAAAVLVARDNWGSEVEFVDANGIGAGVVDALRRSTSNVVAVYTSPPSSNPRFFNKRSQLAWEMAEWVKRGGCLPMDPVLKKELTALTYYLDKGRIRIPEKDQLKKLLGRSPDRSDALALTFAWPDAPAGVKQEIDELERQQGQRFPGLRRAARREERPSWDWDPLDPSRAR